MTMLSVAPVLLDVGRSLREAFFMFWETLWALVLGFTLSGVVQAFVSKDQMRARMGDHRPGTVAKASFFGMVSSSCSYAASAMSKSLFAKGADFITAMAFMIASTNLVIELGIVLLVLLGWQFMAAEFVGGPIMIALLALLGGMVFTAPLLAAARRRLNGAAADDGDHAMSGVSEERQEELEATSWHDKLRSPAAWSDASSYAVADVTMLRKELVIGYVVAGVLAVVVPMDVWSSLFLHGHGIWTSIENALVGPLIAVISWVCSIGNVPLAAALWSGGISFGGVVAFVFADLIAMPLILIYAKFYGWRLAARLVGLFYVIMVLGGLATELLFGAAGLIPESRPITMASARFEWNYTTFLNIAFLLLAGGVWWLARNRERFGGGAGYAIDPVCGMQVRVADAPATAEHDGVHYFFCADRCKERFVADPERFASGTPSLAHMDDPAEGEVVDPVCGMTVVLAGADHVAEHEGTTYAFCNAGCRERFLADPGAVLAEGPSMAAMGGPTTITLGRKPAVSATAIDPVCGMAVEVAGASHVAEHEGTTVYFCNPGCRERFLADPGAYRPS
jgi:YHS domain-containing protein/uncharacterized membrane protein YraQ (UPF0718 family)